MTNPGTATITGHVRFEPADGSTPVDFSYSIPPGATGTFQMSPATGQDGNRKPYL